jgi:hypothetical protein
MSEPSPKTAAKTVSPAGGEMGAEPVQEGKTLAPRPFSVTAGPLQLKAGDPPPDITLGGGVGAKGPNVVSDLKMVQDRLKELGFLSATDFATENTALLKTLKATDKVDASKIPGTISAIKEYERVVLYQVSSSKYNKPTGQIAKAGDIVGMMNAQQAAPTTTEMDAVTTARGTLTTSTLEGGDFTMVGKVGQVASGNNPTDLATVQSHLVTIGKLKSKDRDAETLTALKKKFATVYTGDVTSIQAAHIPKTIAAIESFQSSGQYEHGFWQKRKFDGEDLSKYTWTKGVVEKTDLSGFILSHYRKTQFSYNDENGKAQTTSAKNFVKSAAGTDAVGYSVIGTAEPSTFSVDEFKTFGISDLEARSLLFVSKNEGKFNAVNTWDKAGVSFGFVQFAGGSGGGSYPKMMANLKKDNATVFESKFKQFGIDVEYTEKDGKVGVATLLAVDPVKKTVLRGVEAEEYIRGMPGLMPVFLNAGYDKDVQKAQVKTAVAEYVVPSRGTKFGAATATKFLKYKKDDKNIVLLDKEAETFAKSAAYKALAAEDKGVLTDLTLSGEHISDYLTSEKARAVIIDLAINAGLGGAASKLSQGMKAYIVASKTVDKATLKTASETEVLKSIKPFANFPDRVQKAIDDASLAGS